jgi:hypothetical protein
MSLPCDNTAGACRAAAVTQDPAPRRARPRGPQPTRPRSEALCDVAAGEELRNTYLSAHWRRCFADLRHEPCGGADGVGPAINEAVEERLVSLFFFTVISNILPGIMLHPDPDATILGSAAPSAKGLATRPGQPAPPSRRRGAITDDAGRCPATATRPDPPTRRKRGRGRFCPRRYFGPAAHIPTVAAPAVSPRTCPSPSPRCTGRRGRVTSTAGPDRAP